MCPTRQKRGLSTANQQKMSPAQGDTHKAKDQQLKAGLSPRDLGEWKQYYGCLNDCHLRIQNGKSVAKRQTVGSHASNHSASDQHIGNGVVENVYKHLKNCARQNGYVRFNKFFICL